MQDHVRNDAVTMPKSFHHSIIPPFLSVSMLSRTDAMRPINRWVDMQSHRWRRMTMITTLYHSLQIAFDCQPKKPYRLPRLMRHFVCLHSQERTYKYYYFAKAACHTWRNLSL